MFALAPWGWVDFVSLNVDRFVLNRQYSLIAPYLISVSLCYLALVTIPFLRSNLARAILTIAILPGLLLDTVTYGISGSHADATLIELLLNQTPNAVDAFLDFGWTIAVSSIICFGVAALFMLPPGRYAISNYFVVFSIASFAAAGYLVHQPGPSTQYGFPHPIGLPALLSRVVVDKASDPGPRRELPPELIPSDRFHEISKIVLVIDESVRGDLLSLNDDSYDTTPFLVENKRQIINYGVASSITNCSSATRVALRAGTTEAQLPDRTKETLRAPTFWQFARRAGFSPVYFDPFRRSMQFHSFMDFRERETIDEKISFGPPWQFVDMKVGERLVQELSEPGKKFLVVEKFGVHPPHQGHWMPTESEFAYEPKGLAKISAGMSEERGRAVRHYGRGIRWRVDEFFRIVWDSALREDVVLIYTSDHGQALYQSGFDQQHCTLRNPHIGEAAVPLFVVTGNRRVQRDLRASLEDNYDRASQFEIFPTLLELFGYDPAWVEAEYGTSLLNKIPDRQRRFLARDLFQGDWNSFDP